MYNHGTFTATECVFRRNTASTNNGGAVYNYETFEANDCEFSGNEAFAGQDIYINAAAKAVVLRSCSFLTFTPTEQLGGERVVGGPPLSCDANGGGCAGDSASELLCSNLPNEGTLWGVQCSQPCPLGFYGDPSIGTCSACPSGKFGNSTGQEQAEACELCDDGTFNPYENTTGPTSCTPCGSLTWSTFGAPKCFYVCVLGQYLVGGESDLDCRDCPIGKYNLVVGGVASLSKCEDCEAGYVCLGGAEKVACPKGRYRSATGGTKASDCAQCSPGKYSSALGMASDSMCNPCPAGLVSEAGGASECLKVCSVGTHSSANGTTCMTCPAGQTSNARSAFCEVCVAGTYLDGALAVCVACKPAKFPTAW